MFELYVAACLDICWARSKFLKGVPHYILFYHMDKVTKPVLQMIRPGTSQTVQTQELRGSYGNEIQIMIILYLFLGWGDFYSL